MSYNPFHINNPSPSNVYDKLYKNAIKIDHSKFFELVNSDFNFKNDFIIQRINKLAKISQIVIKKSVLMWLHGYLLYVSLTDYLNNNPEIDTVNILETGTARGFSSLCMAMALKDSNRKGKIHTIDILHHDIKMYWNCIKDEEGKHTRSELFKNTEYFKLLDYIKFYQGTSFSILKNININRFHFAFLDAQHDYPNLNYELSYTKNKQLKGDIIICDDYTTYHTGKLQFPGINKAVDEFNGYLKKIYYGNDGEKNRGYVYLKKN